MDGVLDHRGVKVVVVVNRNNSTVYVGYCLVNRILSVGEGSLEFIKTV